MKIEAKSLGKKFVREWIFKDLSAVFESNQPTAIVGPNGSGKSTLLQILSGFHLPTKGELFYSNQGIGIKVEEIFQYISLATPYLELIEEFTLDELLNFHTKFKPLNEGINRSEFKKLTFLEKEGDKDIKKFSSGMKQRLKLGLCFFTQSEICLLDEPTSNLDKFGIQWYQDNIERVVKDKLLIVSSNQPHEYEFCKQQINIPDYK